MASEKESGSAGSTAPRSPQPSKPVSGYLQRVLDSMADLSRNPAKAPEVVKGGDSYEIVKPSR